jgi:hypothetical protein
MRVESGVPKLAKPGGGLPFHEWFLAKYVFLPKLFKSTTRQQAIDLFKKESEDILKLARGLSGEELLERRLVPRLQGLEDSSRYWSVAMTMEHLVIVGSGMQGLVEKLVNGITNIPPISTADVKPHAEVDSSKIFDDFQSMTDAWLNTASTSDLSKFPNAKYAHPWFGPLTAEQWIVFAPQHHVVHRRQIKQIIKLLRK